MKCPACQFDNPARDKFCLGCGSRLDRNCPNCGEKIPLSAKYCDRCGQGPADGICSDRKCPDIEGERKHVTVLFSDLCDYTPMSERMDPEEVKEIVNRLFGEIAQVITKYDGFIEEYVGDAVMAVFGATRACGDDPVRAIRAAREIHTRIETLSPEYEERIGQALAMHSGIRTGLVVIGEVDLEKGTHGISGNTINLASRLSCLGRPGDILVGGGYLQPVGRPFRF